jgi:hypothetical protein
MRLPWLFAALLLSAAVAALNLLAFEYFLYWRYDWYDLMMHFLGGAAIGVFLIGLSRTFRPRAYLLLFFLVAVGWEVFEYVFGIPREENYRLDTALDLLMDALGALGVYVLARVSVWRTR